MVPAPAPVSVRAPTVLKGGKAHGRGVYLIT
jgi:hypothetical protein